MARTRRIMLCPIANRISLNSDLDLSGFGPNTFNKLIMDSEDTEIYYLCNWNIEDSDYTAISSDLDDNEVLRYTGQTDEEVLSSLSCRYATIDEV